MPPEQRIAHFLLQARRRLQAIAVARAAAAGCLAGALYISVRAAFGAGRRELIAAAAAAALLALLIWIVRRATAGPAIEIERRTPALRNTLVTSEELLRDRASAKPHIRELVFADTASRLDRIDLREIVQARRPVLAAAACVAALAGSLMFGLTRPEAAIGTGFRPRIGPSGLPTIDAIEVVITPPPHTRLASRRVNNPERLEIIEGSHVSLRVEARAEEVTLAAGERRQSMANDATGGFTAAVTIAAEAFLSLTPATNVDGPRRLIPLSVIPDRPPAVRIDEPGRDLFLAAPDRDIPLRLTAQDDFGVSALTLAYTKVSGSGETFEFIEGTLPVSLTRVSARAMSGRAVIRPAALGLATGDLLVYRAVARDSHPSRGPTDSDAFVIEIVSPSEALAEGFSIDDQRDTYALSQQMVILKTERLIAARRTKPAQAIAEEASMIAAEQRRVRAEFVFMMGGEVEDEEVEAEQSHEIDEGREQNRGRRDLLAAIRSMSDAAALLMRPDLDKALAAERRALEALQRALTRSRYILRVLALRERIDDARRLSGDRRDAAGWRRDTASPEPSDASRMLHDALLRLSLLARKDVYGPADIAAITDVAERLLRANLDSAGTRDAITVLTEATRTGRHDAPGIAQLIDRAALGIDAALEAEAQAAAPTSRARDVSDRVRSALADRLRGSGALPSRGGGSQ
ncbi:MAG: hypothetical protein WD690_02290 [Vicinamibacterales bacterium]